ncbi:MAG TPA: sigma-70 family RNA polymerase sigma factor [Cyclobacteriaceae bacterium]|nr:sigma-70 family RNA polymerase sigma factor [Cyclobacteriaceae bacterium]
MTENSDFLKLINDNLGIAHKVCNIYFRDPDDRNDVIQEMMYQLWRSYDRFDGRSKFSTWMYRVCLNTALTYRKKTDRDKSESLTKGHNQIPAPSPVNKEKPLELLTEAIGTLSPVNKAIILLYLDDMTYEEIASITGLTKSNVSVRLVRIKKELEVKLKEKIKDTGL